MTVNSDEKSCKDIILTILRQNNVMISKDRTNVQLHKKFTKCNDIYLEISIEFKSITIIFA